MREIKLAAYSLLRQLLGTEVTQEEVDVALENCCGSWSDEDRESALLLTMELAETVGMTMLVALDASREQQLAHMEHHFFVSSEIARFVQEVRIAPYSEEHLRQSVIRRYLYPRPDDPYLEDSIFRCELTLEHRSSASGREDDPAAWNDSGQR